MSGPDAYDWDLHRRNLEKRIKMQRREIKRLWAVEQYHWQFEHKMYEERRTPDSAQIRADALRAAGQEYILDHVMETDWHRQGRHSAIRGMMVRMGLYAELEAAIDEAIAESATPLSPPAVDTSPAPDAGGKEGV